MRLLLPLLSILLLAPTVVAACSCEPPGTPLEQLELHDGVFAGRVVEIVEPADFTMQEDILVTFATSSVWKGEAGQVIAVSTGPHDGLCGFPFSLGERYLVYGFSWNGGLHTGLCGRTRPLSAATEDIGQLGNPVASWPGDNSEDCCSVPEILGRWRTESDEDYIDWHILEFKPDGLCIANGRLGDVTIVAEFSYARDRTILFGDERRDKVVFDTVRSTYMNRGDGWTPEALSSPPRFFFALGHGDLTAYPYEQDLLSRGARYTRTDRPIYSVTADGRITSVDPATWGGIKHLRRIILSPLRDIPVIRLLR